MVQQTDTVKADRIQAMICHLNMMKGHDERNALWHFNARWSFLCLRVTCTPSSDFWLCVRSFFSLSLFCGSFISLLLHFASFCYWLHITWSFIIELYSLHFCTDFCFMFAFCCVITCCNIKKNKFILEITLTIPRIQLYI